MALDPLMYIDQNRKPYNLPGWAAFYTSLGAFLAQTRSEPERFVVAIAAPTRAFGIALLTAGYMSADASEGLSRADMRQHYEQLCTLSIDTPLYFRKNGRTLRCLFRGCTVQDFGAGRRAYIALQVTNGDGGNLIEHVPWEQSTAIEVCPDEAAVGLPKNQKGRAAVRNRRFLESLLGKTKVDQFLTRSCLKAAVVGYSSLLGPELTETLFYVPLDGGKVAEGTLQDLIRSRRFQGKTFAYRSELVSPSAEDVDEEVSVAPTVFFDGALGFIRHRDRWTEANWVVMLDRTESSFREAADLVNAAFIQRRIDTLDVRTTVACPPGTELIAFRESR